MTCDEQGAALLEIDDAELQRLAFDFDKAPYAFIDRTSLLGPPERIADRLAELAEAGVTTVNVSPHGQSVEDRLESLRVVVSAVERAGLA